jgi:hypothetical protein
MFTLGTQFTMDGVVVTVVGTGVTYRQGTAMPVVLVAPPGGPITRLVGNATYRLA